MSAARLLADAKGTSAIEFALSLPLFCIVLFGIVEGGLLLWTQLGLQHAVEAAARCASVNPTTCGSGDAIKTYAAQQAYGLGAGASIFTYSAQACGNKVNASYTISNVTSLLGFSSVTLTAQSCFPS
jgi:Flp pilus assembly protein TadG